MSPTFMTQHKSRYIPLFQWNTAQRGSMLKSYSNNKRPAQPRVSSSNVHMQASDSIAAVERSRRLRIPLHEDGNFDGTSAV